MIWDYHESSLGNYEITKHLEGDVWTLTQHAWRSFSGTKVWKRFSLPEIFCIFHLDFNLSLDYFKYV